MSVRIQLRGDTAANWTAADPVLASREVGIETNTGAFKFGDGVTAWTLLAYAGNVAAHAALTTAIHGIADTAELVTTTDVRLVRRFTVPLLVNNAGTLTDAPPAGLEPLNQQSRAQVDLRNSTNCRVQALLTNIPAAAGVVRVEFSLDGGTVWATLADTGTGFSASVLKVGPSTAIPAPAKTESTLLRVVVTGDSAADPVMHKCMLSVQPA